MSAIEEESDKKQIEAEEQEAMLPAPVDASEPPPLAAVAPAEGEGLVKAALKDTVTEQGREVKPKFIPIGGIKMPGFFHRNGDKNKEEEAGDAEGDKEEDEKQHKRRRLLFTCPFTRFLHPRAPAPPPPPTDSADGAAPEQAGGQRTARERLRAALPNLPPMPQLPPLRVPGADRLATLLRRGRDKDPEAALASVETLGDKSEKIDDGMENIKLDAPDEPEGQVATALPLLERIRQRKFIKDDLIVPAAAVVLVVLVIVISVLASAGPPAERPLRDGMYVTTLTSCGPVEGVLKNGAYNFYGIPYAAPPTGERRFTYAQTLNNISMCWNGTLNAQAPAAACLQTLENRTVIGQEDCLTVDVVTPHVRYDSPLPVVVLIGANSLEGGIGPLQPSARYARSREVVFVRPNFRLGALGFLALDVLSATKYPPTSGNYGLSDIMAALEWVQLNVKHFGGDPTSVTILGHRAGATLASLLTAVKRAKKLYARAWLTSGSAIFPGDSLQDSESKNAVFLKQSGCEDVKCLRSLDPKEILKATPDTWAAGTQAGLPRAGESPHSWLVLDGHYVRQHLFDAWVEEKQLNKDRKVIVFGTTEHASHAPLLQRRHVNWTADAVEVAFNESALAAYVTADEVFAHFNKTYEGLAAMISAVRYVCPLVIAARQRLDAPMYVVTSAGAGAGSPPHVAAIDADVEAILGTFESNTPEQRRFVAAMQQHFYYFVAHGRLPAPSGQLLAFGQDPLKIAGLPACDLLIHKDVVLRYAHVD